MEKKMNLYVDKLKETILENPVLQGLNDQQKAQVDRGIQNAIANAKSSPLDTDVWIYRMVVVALSLVVILTVAGLIFKYSDGAKIPETLTALGSGALGALAGLLAPSPRQ